MDQERGCGHVIKKSSLLFLNFVFVFPCCLRREIEMWSKLLNSLVIYYIYQEFIIIHRDYYEPLLDNSWTSEKFIVKLQEKHL